MNLKTLSAAGLARVGTAAAFTALAAQPAAAQALAVGAPRGADPILNAVLWMQNTLLGNVATAAAVIAVAAVGFMMLSGRLNWRYGATVIIGCFVLFGAATIVAGIRTAAGGG